MNELTLKKYFKNNVSAKQLAENLKGSQQKTGYDTTSVYIESIENGEFKVEKEHLIKLCEDYLKEYINSEDLNTIGFALMCSDFFYWNSETKSGEIISQVIENWANENIGYDINRKNILLWKEYIETGNYCLDEFELKQKFRSKGKWKKLYLQIDEILWNDWDPIGINDIAPRDEYQSYSPIIFSLKRKKGIKSEDIALKLNEIEKETIGVIGNLSNCKKVADKIFELDI